MSEKDTIQPKRFAVTVESTIALYDVADSLLDLGATDAAQRVADAAYALHRADGELSSAVSLLRRPRKHKRTLRDWREDIQRLGWGASGQNLILPWRASPLQRDAGRAIESAIVKRQMEDVKTDVV